MPYTDEAVAEEETPQYVKDDTEDDETVVEGEDVSGAEQMDRTDVIDPAKGVVMTIKKATLDTYTPRGESDWNKRSLKLQLVVGKAGVDGKGRYHNKHFFPRILIAVNREAYPDFDKKKWYDAGTGGAWGDYNALLKALGFSTKPAPRNDKAFRDSLVGRQVVVDITKDKKQALDNTTGKYVNTDEYVNNLLYRGAPKAAAAPAVEEAAAAE